MSAMFRTTTTRVALRQGAAGVAAVALGFTLFVVVERYIARSESAPSPDSEASG